MKTKILIFVLLMVTFGLARYFQDSNFGKPVGNYQLFSPSPSSTQIPAPTPTLKPLTFDEMNKLYGPCVYLPTLMYHHVQDPEKSKENHQTSISVNTEIFRNQMTYLKSRGYRTINISELTNFINNNTPISKKSILITFDDGYEDFYFNAYPVLKENGYTALIFLPTGLINNYGYLNWSEISEMAAGGMYFANHTWSHKSVLQKQEIIENEISVANTQLTERGLDNLKIFAYPYGSTNGRTESFLAQKGFNLAFTTKFGSILCAKQKYDLPRMRVGNKDLSNYGL